MSEDMLKMMVNSTSYEINDRFSISKRKNSANMLKWKKNKNCPSSETQMKVKVRCDDFDGDGIVFVQCNMDIDETSPSRYSAMLYLLDSNGKPFSSHTIVSVGI